MNKEFLNALLSDDSRNSVKFNALYALLGDEGQKDFDKSLRECAFRAQKIENLAEHVLEWRLCRRIPQEKIVDAIVISRHFFKNGLIATSENYLEDTEGKMSLRVWSGVPVVYYAHADWSRNSSLGIFETVTNSGFVKELEKRKFLQRIQDSYEIRDLCRTGKFCSTYHITSKPFFTE